MAETELHRISMMLAADPNWRDNLNDSETSDWITYGPVMGADNAAGRFTIIDADRDGDLADDVFDDSQIIAQGRFGAAQAAVSAILETGFAPLDWLRYGATTFDDLQVDYGAAIVSENPIQVFDDCQTYTTGSATTSRLECSGRFEFPVFGDTAGSDVRRPDFDVVEQYENVGTEIPLGLLPIYDGNPAIHLAVLSQSTNPYGVADPNGIYWINARGQAITIVNSRIEATLAVRGASSVTLTGALAWEAPGGVGAMLVTNSRVRFSAIAPTLDENNLGANFNPPATPYRGIDSNLSLSDQYPTEFRGIVYSSNDINVYATTSGAPLAITGSVICNDLVLYHSLLIRSLDELLTNVPRGFADPTQQRFRIGTFRRIANP